MAPRAASSPSGALTAGRRRPPCDTSAERRRCQKNDATTSDEHHRRTADRADRRRSTRRRRSAPARFIGRSPLSAHRPTSGRWIDRQCRRSTTRLITNVATVEEHDDVLDHDDLAVVDRVEQQLAEPREGEHVLDHDRPDEQRRSGCRPSTVTTGTAALRTPWRRSAWCSVIPLARAVRM